MSINNQYVNITEMKYEICKLFRISDVHGGPCPAGEL